MPSLTVTKQALLQWTERQLADYHAHRPGSIFRKGSNFLTIQEAYKLQIQVAALRTKRGGDRMGR